MNIQNLLSNYAVKILPPLSGTVSEQNPNATPLLPQSCILKMLPSQVPCTCSSEQLDILHQAIYFVGAVTAKACLLLRALH